MRQTRFTELLGCRYPIQQAGMGPASTPELAAAVSAAGGLGMLGGARVPRELLLSRIQQVRDATDQPFGVNFICDFMDVDDVLAVAEQCRFVEFFIGEPDAKLITEIHRRGALAAWQVRSVDEGLAAQEAGCDVVIAQGCEAGGHQGGELTVLTLIDELSPKLDAALVAAGGIASGRKLAAVLAAGADGVRVGTRFVASFEANAHDSYKQALVDTNADGTVVTSAFAIGWPVPHRVLKSSIDRAAAVPDGEIVGTVEVDGNVETATKFYMQLPTRGATGNIAAMPLYAGESVGSVNRVTSAREIVEELVQEAEACLAKL
jgi:nitronate monooxygenase